MKKFFMMAVMAVCALAANAQTPAAGSFTIAPKVGVNVATLTNDRDISLDSKIGLAAGAEGLYMIDDMFGISVGAMYSQQGAKGDGDVKFNNDYINVPIMANSYLAPGLAVKIGIQPGFLVSDNISVDGKKLGDIERKILDDLGMNIEFESFELSVPIGASYEYKNVVLDARYNWSVSNVIKTKGLKGHNSVFQITLGYRF